MPDNAPRVAAQVARTAAVLFAALAVLAVIGCAVEIGAHVPWELPAAVAVPSAAAAAVLWAIGTLLTPRH